MPSPLFRNFNSRKQQERQIAQEAQELKRRGRLPTGWLKDKIIQATKKNLGSVGSLIEALLRPFGKSLTPDIEKEMEAARHILGHLDSVEREQVDESEGTLAIPQGRGAASGGGAGIPPVRPQYRVSSNPPPDDDDWRIFPEDRPLVEGMIEVHSSNVHSIGYRHQLGNLGPGDLLVRFLGGSGKERSGPGALYSYKSVPYEVFQAFKIAASAGKFVWSHLRVAGTISGHQYDYDLADLGILRNVPRQATGALRGRVGEHYVPRTFRGQRSTLPQQQVRGPRGNLPGWEKRDQLRLRSNTGRRG